MSAVPTVQTPTSLISRVAAKYGVEPNKMLDTLKATAFRQKEDAVPISNEQMMALLIVAEQYGLNPFTKEIYAYPDKGAIVAVVGVDGWIRLINEHPQTESIEFNYPDQYSEKLHAGKAVYDWIEVVIKRKDRAKPVVVREYFDEVVRKVNFSTPWDSHPKRMHRHKALIQAARIAIGFAGVLDDDEASSQIVERDMGYVQEERAPRQRAPVAAIHSEPVTYPQEKFEKELPKWRALIAKGTKTAEDIVSMASSKYPLTDLQLEAINAPLEAGAPSTPGVTFAKVADRLQRAKTIDLLDAEADLIREVADEEQRAELQTLYQGRRTELSA